MEGKVAVVTGSNRGIGREVAMAMAREGARVVVNGRTRELVDEVVAQIAAEGGQAVPSYDTVATMAGGAAIVAKALEAFGQLDILVNNAAVTRDRLLQEMTEEEWDEVIATNLKGPFCCTRAAVEHMIPRRYGRIINITSVAGESGNVGQTNYSAAKGGLNAFTKACAKELGRYNITVNAVAPSMRTRMYDSVPPQVFERILAQRALRRMPEPWEIPPAVIFLASDEASYITGQILGVHGGLSV
ncbi:MAG: 3-oxoacyl-ACP reductase FabG [Clostridia bacterium]|nr:3-oxoacyl-ACP reductase FabG [Clostridia bacterium]